MVIALVRTTAAADRRSTKPALLFDNGNTKEVMFHDDDTRGRQGEENEQSKNEQLIVYLMEQTSVIAELETILTKAAAASDQKDDDDEALSTTQSVIHFLRDLQMKNQQMIQSFSRRSGRMMVLDRKQSTPTSSSLPFASSSSPARASYEFEDIRRRQTTQPQQGRQTVPPITTSSRKSSSRHDETTNHPASASANKYPHETARKTTSPVVSRGTFRSSAKGVIISAAANCFLNNGAGGGNGRLVHFGDFLLGGGGEPSESLLISSSQYDDDNDEEESSSATDLPPTVIASPRKRIMPQAVQPSTNPSPRLAIIATTTSPVHAPPRSRKKTLCPPKQVKLSDVDSSMSVLSDIGASPVREASHRRPPPYEPPDQENPAVTVGNNQEESSKYNVEDDSWSTETPFFDRFRVDYDPHNPRQVIVRPNPRHSRRGKLAERQAAQRRQQQQQLTIDENAPLDLSSKPSPPRRQQQQKAGQQPDSTSRLRNVFRTNETIITTPLSQTNAPSSQHVSFAAHDNTMDHVHRRAFQDTSIDDVSTIQNVPKREVKSLSGQRRTPLTTIGRSDHRSSAPQTRSTSQSLPSSLLLYAEALQLTNDAAAAVPQIRAIGRDEYDAAPRLVHLQVSFELLEAVIDVLNRKIADSLADRPDHHPIVVKRMHIGETDLLLMCRDLLLSLDEDDDDGNSQKVFKNSKNVLSALCYFQRLWLRVGVTPAVFDIIFDNDAVAWGPE